MKAELWVFRVEQGLGNACALIFPDGSGAVIDWGTCRDEPLQELWRLLNRVNLPRLRFVAATHPHADHTLGLEQLLARFHADGAQIDRLVYPTPRGGPGENALKRARHRAKALRIPMSSIAVATLPGSPPAPVLAVGGNSADEKWIVHAIAPIDTAIGNAEVQAERSGTTPGNPTSLVLQFGFVRNQVSLDQGRAILPGDATPATLNAARDRSLQFAELSLVNDGLVIPHHGSSHNWVPWFDGMIRGIAVISAPSGRPKHPSETVLKEAVRICGGGNASRLYCTSFAGACFSSFVQPSQATNAGAPQRSDPCFGDVGIELSPDAPSVIIGSDANGPNRRPFGHCAGP
jgi:hypothetical protein